MQQKMQKAVKQAINVSIFESTKSKEDSQKNEAKKFQNVGWNLKINKFESGNISKAQNIMSRQAAHRITKLGDVNSKKVR